MEEQRNNQTLSEAKSLTRRRDGMQSLYGGCSQQEESPSGNSGQKAGGCELMAGQGDSFHCIASVFLFEIKNKVII